MITAIPPARINGLLRREFSFSTIIRTFIGSEISELSSASRYRTSESRAYSFSVAVLSTEISKAASRVSPGASVPRNAVSSLLVNGSTALIRAWTLYAGAPPVLVYWTVITFFWPWRDCIRFRYDIEINFFTDLKTDGFYI